MTEQFVRDMYAGGKQANEMLEPYSYEEQATIITGMVDQADAVVVVFPSTKALLGMGVAAIKGADLLLGAGIDIGFADNGAVGVPPALRPRRLNRPLTLTPFLVDNLREVQFMELCWGDSAKSRRLRREQRRDGGERAIENMRMANTPAGRRWIKENEALVRAHLQDN